jgi:hypothetical protein
MPNDGGHLLLTDDEKKELLQIEPRAKEFIRRFISAREFLHGEKKWCIWLKGANPKVWHSLPEIRKRVQAVKNHRLDSKRGTTKELADYPFLFGEDRQPNSEYLIIPRVSSENRDYIPIDFRNKSDIVGDTCLFIPKASFYLLGILTSSMLG